MSQGTASNVFNKPDLVRPEVRERVFAAARTLGYRGPDPRGRLLRAGKANAIGVVVSEELAYFFADPYARRFMAGIAEVCDQEGSGLVLISAGRTKGGAESVRMALVDGFIVYSLEDGAHLLEPVRARAMPYVSVDFDGGGASVRIDDRLAATLLARHLLELGHRRFGILGFAAPDAPRSEAGITASAVEAALQARFSVKRDRLAGFMDALGEAGIAPEDVTLIDAPNVQGVAREASARLLRAAPETTAILAMSDVLALGAVEHARHAGLAVPDDLSVTGFDGLPFSQRALPRLTTIAQPVAEKGRRAARMLFAAANETVRLDVELTIGLSTAPPRA